MYQYFQPTNRAEGSGLRIVTFRPGYFHDHRLFQHHLQNCLHRFRQSQHQVITWWSECLRPDASSSWGNFLIHGSLAELSSCGRVFFEVCLIAGVRINLVRRHLGEGSPLRGALMLGWVLSCRSVSLLRCLFAGMPSYCGVTLRCWSEYCLPAASSCWVIILLGAFLPNCLFAESSYYGSAFFEGCLILE
jgi:hypothetical protein